ncbi:hypothetical protein Tco_0648122, partial [Tanacetum coccineum]
MNKPEPSFDHLAISGVPFWHQMSPSYCLDLRSAPEFYFRGSELVRGASSSKGCFATLRWELIHHFKCFERSLYYSASLPSFCHTSVSRCVKLHNITYFVFVYSGLNASWSNLFADHTTILVAEDACLPAPTPDEVICESLPMLLRKLTRNVSKVGSSVPSVKRTNDVKGSADDVNDVDDQDDAHYHSSLTNVAQGGFRLFSLKDFPFVLVINLLYFPLDVVEDALAQGAEGLGLMQNEDHQVLRNEQKLEEDASDCTRVDDDGVEFSPEGGDYFPTIATQDEDYVFARTLQSMNLLTALLVSHGSEMNVRCSSLVHSCERLRLKAKSEFFEQLTMKLTEFKSGIMQQGAGLDELKHDLSTKESMAYKCKDAIIKNKHEIMSLCGANIEPNKADPEEVADLDMDQLPTLASVVLVSSIVPILSLSHKTFAHTTGLMTPDTVCPLTYQLLRSSFGDSGHDVYFDMSASLEHLSGSARARLATSILSSIGGSSPSKMSDEQLQTFVCPGASEPASDMLPYPFAHARLGSGYAGGSFPNSFQWHAPIEASEFLFWNLHVKVSKEFLFPYPDDEALFTKLFGSFGGVSFGSSVESKSVVQLRLFWRLLQLLLPPAEMRLHLKTRELWPCLTNTDATDSGPEPSFDRPTISGVPFWHQMSPSYCWIRGLLRSSALE